MTSPTEKEALVLSKIEDQKESSVLYLAFGSNLSKNILEKVRKVYPKSATPVVIPGYALTFDLAGIPYAEPAFANIIPKQGAQLHGVVYEITRAELFAIFATEGGGAGYEQISVDWNGKPVFTLMCSRDRRECYPSRRYVNILLDGAKQHQMPTEYVKRLQRIRTYEARGLWTKIGSMLFLAFWLPVVYSTFRLNSAWAKTFGKIPLTVMKSTRGMFYLMWWYHDQFWSKVFGRGDVVASLPSDDEAFLDENTLA